MSTFFTESKHMIWPQHYMVPLVSATFQPMMLKTENKFKVFAASRFHQGTIPSQIVLCEFLLINLLHQRPIVLNEYLPPPLPLPLLVQPQWISSGSQFKMLYGLVSWQVDISLLKFPIHSNDCSLKMGLRIHFKMVIFIFVTRHWCAELRGRVIVHLSTWIE